MSDDDAGRTRESIPVARLDDEDDGAPQFPPFPDHDEFVKTQEMDSMRRSEAALETTQRYDVPEDLLQMAMRSQEMEVLPEPAQRAWRGEFVGVVDPRGRIVLPSRVQAELVGKKLRVKYVVED